MEGVRKEVSLNYLSVKNITETSADIYFYGEIVGDEWSKWCDTDKCPEDVVKALKEAEGKDLNIYINSPGGSVFAGLAIYNILKRSSGKKTCYIDGLAASIASVICMAGDEIIMPSNSFLMIHKPWSGCWGNAEELRKSADDLDIIEQGIVDVYKSNLIDEEKIEEIKTLMAEETWLTAEKAAEYFKNIQIVRANNAKASLDGKFFNEFKNIPKDLVKNKEKTNMREKEALKTELELLFL